MNLLTLVLLATIAAGVTAALLAWQERAEPGAIPLVALLVGQCWWTTFLIFQLNAKTLEAKTLWVDISWVGVVIIPVAWLLFAVEYTGRDRFIRIQYVALLSVVPAITVILALTGRYQDLLYVDSNLVQQGGQVVLERAKGPWFWVIAGYTYLLGVLGAIPLLGLVTSKARPFRGQSLAILVGIISPWAINILYLGGAISVPGLDPTPIGFAISGVAYLSAIKKFRLFGTNPAPNQNARRLVFDRMQEGAVVLDSHDYVVDMNDSAPEILGTTPQQALGRPAREVIPEYERLPDDGKTSNHITISGASGNRFYDVTVTKITNSWNHPIGRVMIFHDVGDHLRQKQRLEVLNRVLRHNIRTETNIIFGQADLIDNDAEDKIEQIKTHAMRIEDIAYKARKISEIFEKEEEVAEAVSLEAIIAETVAEIEDEFPEVTVTYRPPPDDVYVSGIMGPVLSNVIRNAAEHNTNTDPIVEISTDSGPDHVRVSVADNGPGIHEEERSVLESGTETPLEHASGLGLWLIKWGTAITDGQVSFRENEPTGSVVTIEVPIHSKSREARNRRDVIEA